MSGTFFLEVLRPSEKVYEGNVISFVAKALDGELGVLSDHAPLLTVLGKGVMKIRPKDGPELELDIPSGIMKIENNLAQVFLPR